MPRPWRALVLVVAFLAGLLFAVSATTAQGTDLRAGRRLRLTELVGSAQRDVTELSRAAAALRAEVDAATGKAAGRNEGVREARRAADAIAGAAGLTPVTGAGLEVSLDDAPRPRPGEPYPAGASPDDLVVHEQDVHAVINALWAGGATAVSVMGERLVATSAVRCVGNTLLLHDAVYSPPFVIRAVGEQSRLADALDREPGVRLFREFVDAYDLGYDVRPVAVLAIPGYDGPL